jgi:hypothetical protein
VENLTFCGQQQAKQQTQQEQRLFKSFGAKKMDELAATNKELTNNFEGLVTSGLGPHIACGPPVELQWCRPTEC